jgi:hypothetical protein
MDKKLQKMSDNKSTLKMNLSLDNNFFDLIQRNAASNYVRPATFAKMLLMRSTLGKNNDDVNTNDQ